MNLDAGRNIARMLGMLVGIFLFALAIGLALRSVEFASFGTMNPVHIGLLALAVVANLLLTGLLFAIITHSFDPRPPVGTWTMIALIALSGLLNYIPVLRPGLWGRAAYLRQRHALPVSQSLLILGIVLSLAAVVLGATATVLLVFTADRRWLAAGLGLILLTACTGPCAKCILRRPVNAPWLWLPLRVADLLVVASRLWLAFKIVGHPLAYDQAILAAAASLLVRLAGITPNGLGLSEWTVAAVASALEPVTAAHGAAAALVDRAVEVVVTIVAGLAAAISLRKKRS